MRRQWLDDYILSLKQSEIIIVLDEPEDTVEKLLVVVHGDVSVHFEDKIVQVDLNEFLLELFLEFE